MKNVFRISTAVAALGLGVALSAIVTGCPSQGVECKEGLTACGNKTCEDLNNDPRNCGACGVSCAVGEYCAESKCQCAPGTVDCGGTCVVTASNPQHCGACANACKANEVCQASTCQFSCGTGYTQCGQSCVLLGSDSFNCGGCGIACDQGKSCHSGQCEFDLVAACMTTGEVVGFEAKSFTKGTRAQLGAAPQALQSYANELLLSIDGIDNRLYQARLSNLEKLSPEATLGNAPNHLLVSPPYVYVTNSGTGTITVLKESTGVQPDAGTEDAGVSDDAGTTMDAGVDMDAGMDLDGGAADAGLWNGGGGGFLDAPVFPNGATFTVAYELDLGANTYPQVMTKVGTKLYVTLYGGIDPATFSAGQKVVELDLANPEQPTVARTFDLSSLSLETFTDGGTAVARPQGITARNGTLYVALNNLTPTYDVAGPAYVATIALTGGAMGLIKLPEDKCLNAVWIGNVGDDLAVSCAGRTDWSNYPNVETTQSGLALVGPNNDVLSAVALACPSGGDAGCPSVSLSRFGVKGSSLFVGDQSAGRVFVVDVQNGQLVEKRTYSAESPLDICPMGTGGFSNVSDVLAR